MADNDRPAGKKRIEIPKILPVPGVGTAVYRVGDSSNASPITKDLSLRIDRESRGEGGLTRSKVWDFAAAFQYEIAMASNDRKATILAALVEFWHAVMGVWPFEGMRDDYLDVMHELAHTLDQLAAQSSFADKEYYLKSAEQIHRDARALTGALADPPGRVDQTMIARYDLLRKNGHEDEARRFRDLSPSLGAKALGDFWSRKGVSENARHKEETRAGKKSAGNTARVANEKVQKMSEMDGIKRKSLSAKELTAIANAKFDPKPIRDLMEALTFDQKQLSIALNTSHVNVGRWLKGTPPSAEYLARMKALADLRGIPFELTYLPG